MGCVRGWYWRLGCILLITVAMSGCPKKTPPPTPSEITPGGSLGSGGEPQENSPSASPGERTEARIKGKYEEGGPLQDIHFAHDSFQLSAEAQETLRAHSNWLKSNPQVKIEIEGHCDARGTAEYNVALGAKRTRTARDYLVTLGISQERLSTISYGEELPLCHEETESCWAQNRRVHFLALNR